MGTDTEYACHDPSPIFPCGVPCRVALRIDCSYAISIDLQAAITCRQGFPALYRLEACKRNQKRCTMLLFPLSTHCEQSPCSPLTTSGYRLLHLPKISILVRSAIARGTRFWWKKEHENTALMAVLSIPPVQRTALACCPRQE